ncbi:hypothetical protein PoB_003335600 [Plakobranchus ocellatus]|uniref:Uncharacterized protein n=1 Tax=Plakobranchus ocellatus TaxID=259542 RepID=A0AAV4A6L6_9GAST|nr:hypothetical protein PoB_003335600 [Plakobranchus ocellatus]
MAPVAIQSHVGTLYLTLAPVVIQNHVGTFHHLILSLFLKIIESSTLPDSVTGSLTESCRDSPSRDCFILAHQSHVATLSSADSVSGSPPESIRDSLSPNCSIVAHQSHVATLPSPDSVSGSPPESCRDSSSTYSIFLVAPQNLWPWLSFTYFGFAFAIC